MPTNEYEEQIVFLLRQLARHSYVHSRSLMQRYGLTGPQLIVLHTLIRKGTDTSGGLSRSVGLSPATMTGILDRLEAKGLVTRTRKKTDRRSVALIPTERAREVVAAELPMMDPRLSERLAGLSDFEKASILNALRHLTGIMESSSPEPPEVLAPVAPEGPVAVDPTEYLDEPAPGDEIPS